jgi:hypothetical protein
MNSKSAIELKYNDESIPFINYVMVRGVTCHNGITKYKSRVDWRVCGNWEVHTSDKLIVLANVDAYGKVCANVALRLDCPSGRQFLVKFPDTWPVCDLRYQCNYNYNNVIEKEVASWKTPWLTIGSYLPLNNDLKFLIKGLIIDLHVEFLDRLKQIRSAF